MAVRESNVRSYSRSFPVEIASAKNARVVSSAGDEYIDFLAGAGALNYGHNDPVMKAALVDYLMADGITHSLDIATVARNAFLRDFDEVVMQPMALDHRIQFTGPTGANAVEAALKLARLVKGRPTIGAFTNSFHGMSLGALSVTGNSLKRAGSGVPLTNTVVFPYDGYFGKDVDTIPMIERLLLDPASGIDLPAAFILETVQVEGGLNVASNSWLKRLTELTSRLGILLIVDDIQTGCGRTGKFFSFASAGIRPDLVCLSKSISGYGLPMSLLLISPELDVWKPGQHNGTFRGNNLAFVAGRCAMDRWRDPAFLQGIAANASRVREWLVSIRQKYGEDFVQIRGRGMLCGLKFADVALAEKVSAAAFARHVIVETCGARDDVLKLIPPLTIEPGTLQEGLDRIASAIAGVCPDVSLDACSSARTDARSSAF